MTRLQSELQRLFGPADGGTRAMVLEVARPADWRILSAAWRGVQAELELPASAIAVNGVDGLQLWFSLVEPVPAQQALDFLQALKDRYLGGLTPHRVALYVLPATEVAMLPRPVAPERWAAFIAPDLAPLFSDEPWLDQPVGAEGQAELLSRLVPAGRHAFSKACEQLQRKPPAPPARAPQPVGAPPGAHPEAARFLIGVMHDEGVSMALRIEAAKALLPYAAPAAEVS